MFAIDKDNGIRTLNDANPLDYPDQRHENEVMFSTFEEFVALSQSRNWSKEDVTEVWNSFAGSAGPFADLKPYKGIFRNRPYGLQKIWDAIQRLTPEYAPDAVKRPTNALDTPESENPKTMKTKKTAKPKASKPRKTPAKAEKKPKAPRAGQSKKIQAMELLKRKSGATIEEISERLEWNKTSCMMLIQWVQWVTKAGITSLEIEKNSKGDRVYKAA